MTTDRKSRYISISLSVCTVSFALLINSGLSQQPSATMCNALFGDGIRNNFDLFTLQEQFTSYQNQGVRPQNGD